MKIGPNANLGGTLNLNGMQQVYFPASDAFAPLDVCTGNGNGGNGNGGNGNGGDGGNGGGSCSNGGGGGDGNGGDGSGDPTPQPVLPSGGGGGGLQPYSLSTSGVAPPCSPVDGPTAACVTLHTRIALFPDGCKFAAEIEVGDLLLTRTAAGELVGEAVNAIRVSVQPCVTLVTEDGRHLHCSRSHEVMIDADAKPAGRRTTASALTTGERLLLEDGTPVSLVAVLSGSPGEVIRLSLAGPHHLYLSEGLWSHNKQQGTGPTTWPTPGS